MWHALVAVDWQEMILPTHSILEMIVRGTIMYLAILVLLRVVLKRESGGVAMTDVLVIVLLADAAQNGMAKEYRSVTEGLVLVATIVLWSYAIDWLVFHVPAVARWLEPAPLTLVTNGRIDRRAMRRELITVEELRAELRHHGIEDIAEVRLARMEADGRISVVRHDAATEDSRSRRT